MQTFKMVVLTPAGKPEPSIAIAASRAGELGVLNLEYSRDLRADREAIKALNRYARNDFGIKVDGQASDLLSRLTEFMPDRLRYVILTSGPIHNLRKVIRAFHELNLTIFYESICLRQAQIGKEIGVDGIVAKGHEAAGRIGEETSFVLLQKIISHLPTLPVWAYGGIGLHTAASCYAAGAQGIVLDSQLLLAKESPLPREIKSRLATFDGSETSYLGERLHAAYRVYSRPNLSTIKEIQEKEEQLVRQDPADRMSRWRETVCRRVGWQSLEKNLFILGQDISFAASLAQRFGTIGGILQGIRQSMANHLQTADFPFKEGSPLARSHGTRYPIVQGPMARISDVPKFARQVADQGALPFIELAMMRGSKADSLLSEAEKTLSGYPWGVGILGFIQTQLLKEQMKAILAHRPNFALVAGGRAEQAKFLEQQKIPTYLHCPSPGMLKIFLKEGLRKFIFEGSECGGHLGPRSSFTLWETCIEILLDFFSSREDASSCQVLFAGGIHDDLSSFMVATLASPLVELGVQTGLQLGSAYLFTQEAVSSGAIVPGFQKQIVASKGTVRLEAAHGYLTRCLPTPFAQLFNQEKQKMMAEGRSVVEMRNTLEALNLGRLRIAAKGVDRDSSSSAGNIEYKLVGEKEQLEKGLYMIGQIAALRDRSCSLTELHQSLTERGEQKFKQLIKPKKSYQVCVDRAPEIAIIGMACILPKAQGLRAYWANILDKVNAIEQVPADRWDYRLYYNQDRKAKDKIYSKWGGFVDEVPFDPMQYGMPPNTLRSIEPLHLLTLEVVREALKDAGYLERSFRRDKTSVIIGAGGGVASLGISYSIRSFLPLLEHISGGAFQAEQLISQVNGFFPEWTEDSFPGILMNVAAGRVANRFDLGGSNFTVDAACASSMAAVYLAVKELQTYSSDMVVVGGSDTMQNPFTYLCFSKTQALSPTGQSRPLDESADGIVLGEGVAMVILKRLTDAERDGDRIYAVIKSVGSSSDGRDKCLTAPRTEGQISALQRAYNQAGICPSSVGLIEAHGTGTVAGDRAEIQALSKIFNNTPAKSQSCAVGSVKSMIGHTKCTAGVAGLIKAALALYSKVLPPTLGVSRPNQKANFEQSPFYVNTDPRPWLKSDQDSPRRAGVSAFGFGGTNFHAVLEEYTQDFSSSLPKTLYQRWPGELFCWETKSRKELQDHLDSTIKKLGEKPLLSELAYRRWETLKAQPAPNGLRLAIVSTSGQDLRQKLEHTLQILSSKKSPAQTLSVQDPRGIYITESASRLNGKIAFLFPGQGSQYLNMAKDLALNFAEVRSCFERIDKILTPKLGKALSDYIFPVPVFTEKEKAEQQKELTRTRVAQPAIGAVSEALDQLLRSLGVCPELAAGHSYGEYVALWAGRVLDEKSLMLLSEKRGQIIEEVAVCCPGTMAAIKASEKQLAGLINGEVWMANYNAPRQTVISGKPSAIEQVIERCAAQGLQSRRLKVSCAFHSPLIYPARESLAEFLKTLTFSEPQLKVYSNTTAYPHSGNPPKIVGQLIDHLTNPVRFKQEIEAMYEDGARIFVEVGPQSILTRLVNQILQGRTYLSVASDQQGRSGLLQLQHCLGQLFVQGTPVNLDRLYTSRIAGEENWQKSEVSTLSPTTWLVRGDRIRPLQEVPQKEQGLSEEKTQKRATKMEEKAKSMQGDKNIKKQQNNEYKKDTGRTMSVPKAEDQVMLQFQEMMHRFLDTQKEVMLRYMETGSIPPASQELKEEEKKPATAVALPYVSPAPSVEEPTGAPQPEPPEEKISEDTQQDAQKGLDRERIQELLLEIVSERTGYPREMLDLNLNMEADLGIDSIKRVEILGSFQREFSSSHGQDIEKQMENLSGAKTLQEIIDWLTKSLEEKKENPVADQEKITVHSSIGEDKKETIQRFILEKKETPCGQPPMSLDQNRLIMITEDQENLANFLADRLQKQGYKTVRVRMGQAMKKIETGYYEADLGSLESVDSLLKKIRQKLGPIGALIHLYPFQKNQKIYEMDLGQWKKRLRLEIKSLFYLAKSLESDLREAALDKGGYLMAVTSMGGSFGSISFNGPRNFSPSQGGCTGLVKSLKHEWPEVNLKAVDLNPLEDYDLLVQHILNELCCQSKEVEVGYWQGNRFTLQPVMAPIQPKKKPHFQIDSSWVIVITGGARGITADVARELARRYQPTLILVGRSPLPEKEDTFDLSGSMQEVKARLIKRMKSEDRGRVTLARVEAEYQYLNKIKEIRTNIKAIQQTGARVYYYSTDVRDKKALPALIDEVYETFGKIDGVIHGAGIIEDKFIKNKTAESFDRVFDTKVDSAFILSQKLRFDSLKFLVFFSSVAGRFGNRGQADYAAANEVLNKLAIYLDEQWPGQIVSINWGPWENSSMVPPELQRQFLKHGVQLISRSSGPQQLNQEICYSRKGEVEVILGGGGWEAALREKEDKSKALPLFEPGLAFPPNEKGAVEIIRELDIARDLYLQDHRLDGTPVMPMAMALELMLEVVSLGWPKWHFTQIRDLRVWRGIIVSKPIKVRLVATPIQPVSSQTLVVKVEIQDTDQPSISHYSIMVEMGKEPIERLTWSPPALKQAKPFALSTKEAYQQMLFHGHLFQGIASIEKIGVNGLQGILTPSNPQELLAGTPLGNWLLDPVIVDSGLQMLILWSRTYWDMMPLPSRFQLFRVLSPLSGSRILFQSRILPQSVPGTLHADLAFFNEKGELIALLEDMEAACSKALNRLAKKNRVDEVMK